MEDATILITGANRGIGLEFVRQYVQEGWNVLACCRKPSEAYDLQELCRMYRNHGAVDDGTIKIFALDVTDIGAISKLAQELQGQAIDVIVNNAGSYGEKGAIFGDTNTQTWQSTLLINTLAPLKVCEALHDNILAGKKKVLAFISSRMGSIADNDSGGRYIYRSSKAALNAVVKSLSIDLKNEGVIAISFHPGWVKTAMGGPNALITVEESVQGMRQLIAKADLSCTGHFLNYRGDILLW